MKIRDFQDNDVETFVAIRNRAVPAEPTSAEQFRQAPQDDHFTRTLEIDGKAQGFGVLRPWPFGGGPGRWAIGVYVHEDFRRRGLGRKIYKDLCAEADRKGWESLRSGYYESTEGAAGFSKALGFVPWLREDAFSLDLDRDFKDDLAEALARLKLDGVELSTFDLWDKPEKEKLFYEFCLPIFRMVPEMQGDPDPDFETFHKHNLRQPPFRDDCLFIALKEGELLGYSQHRLPPGGQPFIHMTGVHPDHQRKGVARALKLHSQQVQKDRGFKRMGTGSAEDNQGMQALNRELGFYVSDSYLFVKRDREGGSPEKE
jgi:GNAT superfamily N-acetyltransferase